MAAIELGIPYYLYNPGQTDYVCLNVPSDSHFVGYVNDVTGLDDAEVRENAQYINAGDGGIHGRFWRGRRPWTISGFIMPTNPTTARSAAVEHMEAVLAQCFAQDGWLMWTQYNNVTKYIPFRKQQPFRDTKGQSNVQRNFLVAGVCADYRIYGWNQHNVNVNATVASGAVNTNLPSVSNVGNADAPFTLVVTGPTTGFTLVNSTTGKAFTYSAAVAAGHTVTVDLTGRYPTVIDNGADVYGSVNVLATDWSIAAAPGANAFYITTTASSAATNAQLQWRDAWA